MDLFNMQSGVSTRDRLVSNGCSGFDLVPGNSSLYPISFVPFRLKSKILQQWNQLARNFTRFLKRCSNLPSWLDLTRYHGKVLIILLLIIVRCIIF